MTTQTFTNPEKGKQVIISRKSTPTKGVYDYYLLYLIWSELCNSYVIKDVNHTITHSHTLDGAIELKNNFFKQ